MQKSRPKAAFSVILLSFFANAAEGGGKVLLHDGPGLDFGHLAGKLEDVVMQYARNAKNAGLDGVVCSPLESPLVHENCGSAVCVGGIIRLSRSRRGSR